MILSDKTIRERLDAKSIIIEPFNIDDIQPSSIDLRLDTRFMRFRSDYERIDTRQKQDLMYSVNLTDEIPEIQFIDLFAGEFMLGNTAERVEIPHDIVGRLEGKSSLARLGLIIHTTAGYIDPGFKGHITLELLNVTKRTIRIYCGDKIGQLSFGLMTTPADRPYGHKDLGSKYQNQDAPTASKAYLNYKGFGHE